MAAGVYRIAIEVVGKDKGAAATLRTIDQSLGSAGRSAGTAASSFKNLAGAFTAMLVANKMQQGIGYVLNASMDFEASVARVSMLTQHQKVNMDALKKSAVDAASKTTYAPQEAMDALGKLTQATGNADTAMASLDSTLGLAMASLGKLSPEQASRMAGDVIKAFGMEGQSKEEINRSLQARFDQLFNVSTLVGTPLKDFEKVMGRLGQAATMGGQTYEEALLGMALATRGAPSSLRASNQWLRLNTDLVTKASEIFPKLGISVRDAENKIRPYSELLMEMAAKYAENPEALMMALTGGGIKGAKGLGSGALQAVLTQLNSIQTVGVRVGDTYLRGADALDYYRKSMMTTGTVTKAAALAMDTGKGSVQLLKEAFDNVARIIGETMLPHIKMLSRWLKSGLDSFRAFAGTKIGSALMNVVGPATLIGTALISVKASLWGIKNILGVSGMNVFGGAIEAMKKWREASIAAQAANTAAVAADQFNAFKGVGGGAAAGAAGQAASASSKMMAGLGAFKGHLIIGAIIMAMYALIKQTEAIIDRWGQWKKMIQDVASAGGSMANGMRAWLASIERVIGKQFGLVDRFDAALKDSAYDMVMRDTAKLLVDATTKMVDGSVALKDNFTIASGMLQKSLDDLKDMTKAKTQVIDVRQMRSIMSTLQSTKFSTAGDEMTRRGALTVGKSILADLRKMTTKGLSPAEHRDLAKKVSAFAIGAEDLSTFHRGTISAKAIKTLQKQLVDPTLASGSIVQARRTTELLKLRQGISFVTSGAAPLPGYNQPGLSAQQLEMESLDPTLRERRLAKEKRDKENAAKDPVQRLLEQIDIKGKDQLSTLKKIASTLEDIEAARFVSGFFGV